MNTPWFSKRKYGFGWGLPATWQGWITIIIWVSLVIFSTKLLPSNKQAPVGETLPWFGVLGVLTLLLITVCYITSGKPEWHWGNDEKK